MYQVLFWMPELIISSEQGTVHPSKICILLHNIMIRVRFSCICLFRFLTVWHFRSYVSVLWWPSWKRILLWSSPNWIFMKMWHIRYVEREQKIRHIMDRIAWMPIQYREESFYFSHLFRLLKIQKWILKCSNDGKDLHYSSWYFFIRLKYYFL